MSAVSSTDETTREPDFVGQRHTHIMAERDINRSHFHCDRHAFQTWIHFALHVRVCECCCVTTKTQNAQGCLVAEAWRTQMRNAVATLSLLGVMMSRFSVVHEARFSSTPLNSCFVKNLRVVREQTFESQRSSSLQPKTYDDTLRVSKKACQMRVTSPHLRQVSMGGTAATPRNATCNMRGPSTLTDSQSHDILTISTMCSSQCNKNSTMNEFM